MLSKLERPNAATHLRACLDRPSARVVPRGLFLALIITALIAVGDRSAQGQLVIYDFTDDSLSPNTAANISASNFGIGPGITAESASNFSFSGNGVPSDGILLRSPGMTATEAGADAGNDYLSFSVAPDTDFVLNLESLTFDLVGSDNSSPNNNYVGEVAVRSSLDGFANTLATFAATNAGAGNPMPAQWDNESLDLTGAEFQGVTTPIEFRLFLFANANSAGDVTRFDNVTLNGTAAAVPEPASLALWSLLGLGFGALLLIRRGRKAASERR